VEYGVVACVCVCVCACNPCLRRGVWGLTRLGPLAAARCTLPAPPVPSRDTPRPPTPESKRGSTDRLGRWLQHACNMLQSLVATRPLDTPLSSLSKTLQHLLAGGVGASAEGGWQGVRVGVRGGSGGRVVWSAEEQGWWRNLALLRRGWAACRPLPPFETSCVADSGHYEAADSATRAAADSATVTEAADSATRAHALSGLLAVRRLDASGRCLSCSLSVGVYLALSLSLSIFLSLFSRLLSWGGRTHFAKAHSFSERMELLLPTDAQETRGSTTTYMARIELFLARSSPLAALAPLAFGRMR